MGKSPGNDKNGVKKGPWTAEEDQKLIDYIQKHGHGKWKTLPKNAGLKRCGKSCRLRWTNYLRPDIKRGKFSPDEEETIIQLHKVLGNKWSTIATHLSGRTDNEIKNYWNTHIKKKLLRMGINPVTHNPQLDLLQLSSVLNSSLCGSSYQTHQLNPLSDFLGLGSLLNADFLNLANNLFFDIQNQNQYPSLVTSNSEVSNQTQNMDSNLDQFSSAPTNLSFNYQNVLPHYCYGVQNNQDNLSNQNHMYLSTDNINDNIFKNMSFTSILSSTTPSSSSTPLNSSSTLTNINGNNEDDRDSYCSNHMLFDMSNHSDVINDRFM